MKDARICPCGKIWDLHIHSNQCYSCTDPKLRSLSVEEYVNSLLELLECYEDLDMISFTDHNHISVELYRAFYNAGSRITLLPGIEIDVALEEGGASKHLIVYFDAINDIVRLEPLAEKLNRLLDDRNVGSGKGKMPIDINVLLDNLVTYGVHFALSPHAMKQGKRGIDYDWHPMPYEEKSAEMNKYLDQFFCFWESSGKSEIAHAVDFLRQMDRDELMSIVSFSDSKDFEKLKSYLDNPCQYFNSLPNFNGLKLAGSEISRITKTQDRVELCDLGKYIGSVEFEGQRIEFSPRMNAIIGGRGSGKSVLLDSIACSINADAGELRQERRDFVTSRMTTVYTLSGVPISQGQFGFDYFNQSYIANIFEKTGKDFNEAIEKYFASAFEAVERIDRGAIERANEKRFSDCLQTFEDINSENIYGFVEKYTIDSKDSLDLKIGLRKSKAKVEDAKIKNLDYETICNDIRLAVEQKLPPSLLSNQRIDHALFELEKTVISEAFAARQKYLESAYFQNEFVDKYIAKKTSLSDAQATRAKQRDLFESKFNQKSLGIKKRVALVRALIDICEGFKIHYEQCGFANGERENSFKFVRELSVEHPIDFMVRTINSRKLALPGQGKCSRRNLWTFIQSFCFDEDGYKKGSDWEQLYSDLVGFKLNYIESSSIRFDDGHGVYRDIRTMSPGTQTNILLEYIVHKDTSLPLLIDQPEDNVDNQTIYSRIRGWFMDLKRSRQVIVVTHDANIVINADAENVVVAEQPKPSVFKYAFGALEYDDILGRASLILDGGKEAVKRRLVKYGD